MKSHKELGQELNLFYFSEKAPGMVYWKPNGYFIYREIENYLRSLLFIENYQEIKSPIMAESSLWKKSGHLHKFKENMFFSEVENHNYAIKPMNCPLHIDYFKSGLISYRDLPMRVLEFGHCHRNESSGALNGLLRLRSFVQDDGHIFCSEEQIEQEVEDFVNVLFEVYEKFGFSKNNIEVFISLRPDNKAGEDSLWDVAEEKLQNVLNKLGVKYELLPGEGAFYGPKIEFSLRDSLNRVWQCGTIQLDYVLSKSLNAKYINKEGKKEYPIILHRAILGSIERFIAILLEHYQGKLPQWLNPVSVSVISVSEKHNDYAERISRELKKRNIPVYLDNSDQKVNYKIKQHYFRKGLYIIVIGDKEIEENKISIKYENKELNLSLEDFISLYKKNIY